MNWFGAEVGSVLLSALSAIAILVVVIALTRLVGLRSLSKLSAFDLPVTVAIGSIIAATVVAPSPSLMIAGAALGSLYLLQLSLAMLRVRSPHVRRLTDNPPVLLMNGTKILDDNLRYAKLTRADLYAKLREANVIDWSEIKAVVMETTGDVSVLHGASQAELDPRLLDGVETLDDRQVSC